MQDVFGNDSAALDQLARSISQPRLSKYLQAAGGHLGHALALYRWNALLAQSLYTYVQAWEVCLRNRLDQFFAWKYSVNWPYDQRFIRNVNGSDRRKILDAIQRQESGRGHSPVPTSAIVADLSAGFWVAQFSYDIPYSWRHNIARIFPNDSMTSRAARAVATDILEIRNRIAHHEPIFNQPLRDRHAEMRRMVAGMCTPTFRYAESMCSFAQTMTKRPS